MLKKRFLIILLILFYSFKVVFPQEKITGIVVDNSKKPVSYATVQLLHTNIGTITNLNGNFTLNIPGNVNSDSIKISILGYNSETLKVTCNNEPIKVTLKPNAISLHEIQVKPKDALFILKKAIDSIPNNYGNKPLVYKAFYRELIKEDNKYTAVCEAICEIQKSPGVFRTDYKDYGEYKNFYTKNLQSFSFGYNYLDVNWIYEAQTNPADFVRFNSIRNNAYTYKTVLKPKILGGPLGMFASNWVKNQTHKGFMLPKLFSTYEYIYGGITTYDNRKVYLVKVATKKIEPGNTKPSLQGEIYIDTKSYAIICIKYWRNPIKYVSNKKEIVYPSHAVNISNPSLFQTREDFYNNTFNIYEHRAEVHFRKTEDLWTLNYIKRTGTGVLKFADSYIFKEDSVKYSYSQTLNVVNVAIDSVINDDEQVFKNDGSLSMAFFESDYAEKKDIWNNWNKIESTILEDSIKDDLEEKQSLEMQFINNGKFIDTLPQPKPNKKEHKIVIHEKELIDNYYWLQNITDSNVMAYIDQENDYSQNIMRKNKGLYLTILNEINRRNSKQAQISNHTHDTIYLKNHQEQSNSNYYWLATKDKEIKVYDDESNEILFNCIDYKELVGLIPYYACPNKSKTMVIFLFVDQFENTKWKLFDLTTKSWQDLPDDKIEFIYWFNNLSIVYDTKKGLYLYDFQNNKKPKKLISINNRGFIDYYFDNDYLIVHENKNAFSNYYFIKKDNGSKLNLIADSISDSKILVKAGKSGLILENNKSTGESRLTLIDALNNKELIYKTGKKHFLKDFVVKGNKLIVVESHEMIDNLRIINLNTLLSDVVKLNFSKKYQEVKLLKTNSDAFLELKVITAFEPSIKCRLHYDSNKLDIIQKQNIIGYNKNNYKVIRKNVKVDKGIKVPVILIANKQAFGFLSRLRKKPLLLSAYGSYGVNLSPELYGNMLSLLDRDITIAYAHVRGGGELGQKWKYGGYGKNKINTVTDFVKVSKYLINKRYTGKGLIIAEGTSAGGIPIASAVNMNPELFNTAILRFPAVNFLNNNIDSTNRGAILLRKDYGDHNKSNELEKILQFEPYYTISKQKYPNILVINSLNDPRVKYWQGLKYIAKLREKNISNNTILLKTLFSTGHNAGENDSEINAFIYSWIIDNCKNK